MGKIRIKTLGLAEIEEQQKKEAEKRRDLKKTDKNEDGSPVEEESTQKKSMKKSRSTGTKRSAAYTKSLKLKTSHDSMDAASAVALIKKMKHAKFDESIDMHLSLGSVGLKGEVSLPHGTGKKVRVVVVSDDVIAKIESGVVDFDVLIARPDDMPKLSKLARVLGPKGLMPNPKKGTVTTNTADAVKKFEGGSIQFKSEAKFPLIHQQVGKASFTDEQLVENIQSFIKAIGLSNIKEAYLAASMTPSIKLSI